MSAIQLNFLEVFLECPKVISTLAIFLISLKYAYTMFVQYVLNMAEIFTLKFDKI